MKTDLTHLPPHKQQELAQILQVVRSYPIVEMLILFGSYARGDWREKLSDDGIHFIYQSDYDLLAIVETSSTSKQTATERDIKKAIDQIDSIQTPVSIIVHDLEFVNRKLARAQYFFSDIKNEGVLLYDSGKFHLKPARELSAKERYQLAKEDFDYWLTSAKGYYRQYELAIKENQYAIAAFLLHQATERLYCAILLVFTRYKPNTHSLETLRKLVNALDPRFVNIFPLNTNEEKYHFKLLCNAYVEARYKPSYAITPEELEWLSKQVNALMSLADELCQEKIASFGQKSD